ncbi:MAG TPA: alkaline shock response membrane anchor protein AmaP [Candidatus Omnitrophota bacterium]|nr:alkaline shock response membrane anchor protein AmaP [Candidatus Omnitrophota bacterium]
MFLRRVTVLFYVTIILFIGSFLLLFALKLLNINDLYLISLIWYHDKDLRLIIGIIAGIILLCNFLFYNYFSVNVHRDKIIAFDNPSGRVSISLVAMEDLIRRLLIRLNEIRDGKVKITASKKGLDVKIRLVMKSEVNIPELTARVQDKVRRKIQDTIGLEESVNVSIYVGKILPERVKEKAAEEEQPQQPAPTVPFRGYRA